MVRSRTLFTQKWEHRFFFPVRGYWDVGKWSRLGQSKTLPRILNFEGVTWYQMKHLRVLTEKILRKRLFTEVWAGLRRLEKPTRGDEVLPAPWGSNTLGMYL